jgi:hypothetical protein
MLGTCFALPDLPVSTVCGSPETLPRNSLYGYHPQSLEVSSPRTMAVLHLEIGGFLLFQPFHCYPSMNDLFKSGLLPSLIPRYI